MFDLTKILIDGGILSLLASIWLMLTLRFNARIFLHDYPPAIQEKVLPKTVAEKRLTYVFGIPFMLLLIAGSFFSTVTLKAHEDVQFWALWLNAAGIMFVFNVVDWLVLDWLIFCTIIPNFVVIPGSEGMAAYKDYGFHFRGFLHGIVFSAIGGLIIATIIFIK